MNQPVALSLDELLGASNATAEFKEAVRALEAKLPQERIRFNPGAPPVKVLRFIMKLLEARPDLPVDHLEVRGTSGCSDYRGEAFAQPGNIRIRFAWDCRWQAEQLGWRDAFGDPDQIRAARTFGYQCFQQFEVDETA